MKVLTVFYHGTHSAPICLGQLAFYEGKGQFEYSEEALASNIQLSPYNLKLEQGLIEAKREPFSGIHGLFNDSLPDGWGLYVMDKTFKKHGIDLDTITPIDRLAFIGDRAMGALSYQPDEGLKYFSSESNEVDIDQIARESIQIYSGELESVIDELSDVGSPSGGARPKALLGLKDNHVLSGTNTLPDGYKYWMIKFPTGKTPDKRSEGSIEYLYSQMAGNSGIDFPETQLTAREDDNHYFMVKRFDRSDHGDRMHIHTLAGMLNLNFRIAMVGYSDLLKVCSRLTGSHKETTQLFRRMLFNIMSGNRDDHSKNFSFMMDETRNWINSPAYDIVYNNGMNGEHTMDINGKGRNFTLDDINELAKLFSISKKQVISMISDVSESLAIWQHEAHHYDIPKHQIVEISEYINRQRKLLEPKF
ncbi:MAG: type II toxin-antitoxin system HipA family toxin [Pseudomonadales bacterium]